jgi:hypothetical protein
MGQRVTNGMTLLGLDDLCDDPARDVSGQEVQAILTPTPGGYTLSARDGEIVYPIIRDDGTPLTFRSIEAALDRLVDVPFLQGVHIDVSTWRVLH